MGKTWDEALELLDKFRRERKLVDSGLVEHRLRHQLKSEAERLELFRGSNEEWIIERLRPYDKEETKSSEGMEQHPPVVDLSSAYVESMLQGPSLALPGTRFELDEGLEGARGIKLPVTRECYARIEAQDQRLAQQFLLPTDGSALPAALTTLLLLQPPQANTEMNISIYVGRALETICTEMELYSELKVRLYISYNAVERDTSSRAILKGLRPDTLWCASHCTLLVAEDKKRKFSEAIADLQRKRVKLSKLHHGELQFLIGYAAAEGHFQLFWLGVEVADVHAVGDELDLALLGDRVKWVQYLIFLYRLSDVMAKAVPHLTGRFRLFEVIARDNGTEILILDDGIRKTIKKFDKYCDEYKTSLEVLKRAYAAAKTAADAAMRNGDHLYMNCARTGPELDTRTRSSTYEVRTFPLGYNRPPQNSKDVRAVASACCKTAAAFHAEGLVVRDFRLPNVVCLSAPSSDDVSAATTDPVYMCVDFEGAALEGVEIPPGFGLSACEAPGVLDEGRKYTRRSDMAEIGVMIEAELISLNICSGSAQEFVVALKRKESTAEQAVQHAWLTGV